MKIQIDKGIPIPPTINRNAKYPWKLMVVGDSFFVSCAGRSKRSLMQRKSHVNQSLSPKRFEARCVNGGVRVWRVK
jgi:hypothetical protein